MLKLNGKILFSKNTVKNINKKENLTINHCDEYNCIFKTLKSKFKYENLGLLEETIDFRYKLFQNFKNLKYNIQLNLSESQIANLNSFSRLKPFKVVDLDKNVGSALISNSLYNSLGFYSLIGNDIYIELELNPLILTIDSINLKLNSLLENNNISKRLFNLISKDIGSSKLGSYRLLPKIHKEKFSCRPIVNCRDHPTSNLSQLINLILQPHVQSSFSYIKDSQDLILKSKNLHVPENAKLFSCDFESLYTNILLDSLLNVICDFMKPFLISEHLSISGFYEILKLVLYNNIFSFEDRYFKQIKGIAMGTICGPALANLYLSNLEKHWLIILKPLFYVRFIDDIFVILSHDLDKNHFESFFLNLKISICSGNSVNFLDLVRFLVKFGNTCNNVSGILNRICHVFENAISHVFDINPNLKAMIFDSHLN